MNDICTRNVAMTQVTATSKPVIKFSELNLGDIIYFDARIGGIRTEIWLVVGIIGKVVEFIIMTTDSSQLLARREKFNKVCWFNKDDCKMISLS